jgi:hypothetical protein
LTLLVSRASHVTAINTPVPVVPVVVPTPREAAAPTHPHFNLPTSLADVPFTTPDPLAVNAGISPSPFFLTPSLTPHSTRPLLRSSPFFPSFRSFPVFTRRTFSKLLMHFAFTPLPPPARIPLPISTLTNRLLKSPCTHHASTPPRRCPLVILIRILSCHCYVRCSVSDKTHSFLIVVERYCLYSNDRARRRGEWKA